MRDKGGSSPKGTKIYWVSCRSEDPCECSYDGISGGVDTGRKGCKQHLFDMGDNGRFCMVKGGVACTSASASSTFSGAAWKLCE